MGKVTSIITEDTKHCIVCGKKPVHIHHVFEGYSNRHWSEKYHIVIPLCPEHHNMSNEGIHFNKEMDTHFKKLGQEAFEKAYPKLNFRQIFGKNYK